MHGTPHAHMLALPAYSLPVHAGLWAHTEKFTFELLLTSNIPTLISLVHTPLFTEPLPMPDLYLDIHTHTHRYTHHVHTHVHTQQLPHSPWTPNFHGRGLHGQMGSVIAGWK